MPEEEDWVNLSKRGGKGGVFQGLAGLLRGIYILFIIGFRIGPPKMHRRFLIRLPKIRRRFCISPPKMHRRFRIGPHQVSLNLLLPEFNRWGILLTIAIMNEKQQNHIFGIECISKLDVMYFDPLFKV